MSERGMKDEPKEKVSCWWCGTRLVPEQARLDWDTGYIKCGPCIEYDRVRYVCERPYNEWKWR